MGSWKQCGFEEVGKGRYITLNIYKDIGQANPMKTEFIGYLFILAGILLFLAVLVIEGV